MAAQAILDGLQAELMSGDKDIGASTEVPDSETKVETKVELKSKKKSAPVAEEKAAVSA
jgi:hypothetical protein